MRYAYSDAESAEHGYPATGSDARAGNIVVIKTRCRTCGYQLFNRRLGKAFFWYRYRSDPAKIVEMHSWGLS